MFGTDKGAKTLSITTFRIMTLFTLVYSAKVWTNIS
jgi:hypothetical protein